MTPRRYRKQFCRRQVSLAHLRPRPGDRRRTEEPGKPRGWCESSLSETLIRAHPVVELCGRLKCSPDRSHRWWRLLRCFFRDARPICLSSCQKLTLISCGISHESRRVYEYPWERIWKRKEEKRSSRPRALHNHSLFPPSTSLLSSALNTMDQLPPLDNTCGSLLTSPCLHLNSTPGLVLLSSA